MSATTVDALDAHVDDLDAETLAPRRPWQGSRTSFMTFSRSAREHVRGRAAR
jgi:hypothetical protein